MPKRVRPYSEMSEYRKAINGFVIAAVLVVTGCSSVPYAVIGTGYDFNKGDYAFFDLAEGTKTPFHMNCVIGYAALGQEWRNGVSVEYVHQSCIDPSRPAEKVTDTIVIKKKWGGL